ncbi:DMT family transporter [Streptomyces angustmyceticus]|uniref:DMT family transporter n=1 Tax=Streptomyces angustmyceticus TaxID=285578 RepID=UPI003D9284A8
MSGPSAGLTELPGSLPAPASRQRSFRRGPLPVLIAALTWGTTGTAAHFAPTAASPLAIGAVTMGCGGLILLALAGRSVLPLLRAGRRALLTALAGALCVAIYPLAFYSSMAIAGVAIGTVVSIGSSPVFAVLIERVLDGSRLNARWAAATAVSAIGVVFLVNGHHGAGDQTQSLAAVAGGTALGLVAGATYAGYSYAAGRLMRQGAASRPVMGLIFGGGAVLLLPVLVLTGGPLFQSTSGLVVSAYLAVVPMSLAYVLFGIGLSRVSASTATSLSLVEPVVAAVLSVLVVGEHLGLAAWGGVALVGAGVLLLGMSA